MRNPVNQPVWSHRQQKREEHEQAIEEIRQYREWLDNYKWYENIDPGIYVLAFIMSGFIIAHFLP